MSSERQDLVAEAGRLLFGDRWMSDLARELGVAVRTMQSWFASPGSNSYRDMPASILGEVRTLVDRRRSALGDWVAKANDP